MNIRSWTCKWITKTNWERGVISLICHLGVTECLATTQKTAALWPRSIIQWASLPILPNHFSHVLLWHALIVRRAAATSYTAKVFMTRRYFACVVKMVWGHTVNYLEQLSEPHLQHWTRRNCSLSSSEPLLIWIEWQASDINKSCSTMQPLIVAMYWNPCCFVFLEEVVVLPYLSHTRMDIGILLCRQWP